MKEPTEEEAHWHLDKRVQIALILALVMQTAGALTWAGAASERISQLERRTSESSEIGERTARVEEQVRYMRTILDRIEQKLDRVVERE
ncbi:MAG: hypothetical protein CML99_09275 [Rhodobiaceae bacterium]|nr:hypothetical protein [Rhodobiaceae bacterium]